MFASLLPSPAADFVLQQSPPRRRSRCRDQHHHDHNPQQRFSRPPSRQPPPPPTPARTAAAASPFPLSQQDEPGPGGSPAGLFLPKRLDPKSRRRRERKDAPEADAGALSRAGPTGPNLASAAVAAAAHNSAPHPGAPPRIAPAPASAAAEALPAAGSSGRRTHPSWRSLSALNAVASVLLTPLSLPSTSSARSNLVPDVSFLAPELLKEHRVRMYEDLAAGATLRSSRSAGGPPQSPSRWSDAAADEVSAGEVADRSRQRRKSDARRRKASAAAVHDDDTALPAQPTAAFRRDLASFSPTEDDLAAVSPEVSLFTAFQATVACVAERGQDEEDDQTEDEGGNGASVVFRRRKSGRRRSRTIGGLAAVPEVPPAGAARAELSRAKCALVRECERIEARKVQAEKDLQEVESLLLNLATKRDKLQLRLLELEERQEGVSGSLVEVNARLSGMSSERARIHYRKQPNSAFASAVASGRRSTEEYEHEAGTCLATFNVTHGSVTCVDVDIDRGIAASGSTDCNVRIWDVSTQRERVLQGHRAPVRCMQLTGDQLATGSNDGTVRLWNMLTVKEDWEEEERKREEESVREQRRSQRGRRRRRRGRRRAGSSADSASSRSSFASEEDPAPTPPAPPSAGAEAPSSGKAPPLLMELAEHEAAVTCLYREGATLVTGSADKTMRQWDLAAGGKCVLSMDVLWTMSAPPSSLSSFLAPSPGPPTLPRSASGSAWAGVAPWEPAAIGDDHGAGGFVGALQFWGSALACGTADGAIRMWDLRTGQAHRTLQGHAAGVTSLGFDAVHVVSGSFDRTVRVWDLRTGATAEVLQHGAPVSGVSFDRRLVACAAGDPLVKVYDRALLQQGEFRGHAAPVQAVKLAGRRLASGDRGGVVKLWSA